MNDDEKEVLKAGAEAALRPITDIIDFLIGGPAEQIGGMVTDTFAARRQIRRIALAKKVQAAIKEAGFDPRQIPDSIGMPVIREALLQDDETLQDIWANLLSNAADPRQIDPVLPSFSQILKEFTPREARFLDALHTQISSPDGRRRRQFLTGVFTERDLSGIYVTAGLSRGLRLSNLTVGEIKKGGNDLRNDIKADQSDLAAMIDVLVRNRILRESATPNPIDLSKMGPPSKWIEGLPRSLEATATTRYHITDLGRQFIKACQAPTPSQPEAKAQ